ncbi:hypothetical protein F4801DRAFT_474841 [Xylaria longipes]|nr:hypothetical protein F4801DRAFT_474841 [Xylaria longipes]RYC56418.1 hypothetical protein CHU98_g9806 [Xylaria longipes]
MCHPKTLVMLLCSLILFSRSHAQDNCYGDKSIAGYCTPLTFTDTTATFEAAPTTSECQDTCRGINEDAGDWLVDFSTDPDGARHSISLYPCGFAVSRGDGTPADASFSLANQDILDLYDESLSRFGGLHSGKISAQGTMLCGDYHVNWLIQDLSA